MQEQDRRALALVEHGQRDAVAAIRFTGASLRRKRRVPRGRLHGMTTFTDTIQLGDAVEHGGIVLAPLFPRRAPHAEYVTLEEALPLGFRVTEVDASGSVPELLATNPLDASVLLYDGEELLGAKQNRILNVTVLVAARSRDTDPGLVRRGGALARAQRRLRSCLACGHAGGAAAEGRAAAGGAARARAGAGRGLGRGGRDGRPHGVHSPTGAQADVFRARGRRPRRAAGRRSRSSPASRARSSRSTRSASASTGSRGPRRSRGSTRSSSRATSSTRSRRSSQQVAASPVSNASSPRRQQAHGAGAPPRGSGRTCACAARASSARGSSSTAS